MSQKFMKVSLPILLRPSSLVHVLTFHIFDISSESSVPILTKLGMHDPLDKGFQICTNRVAGL